MGMNLSSGKAKGVTPSMNVTPLVDVVLVLLIIFMVVTPLVAKQFWLNVPKNDTSENSPPPQIDADKPVVLTVDAQGALRINRQDVARGELKDKLRRIFAARESQVLFFDAGDDVPYGIAAATMDLARTAGPFTISILTEKTE